VLASPTLSPERLARRITGFVFLTVFLDLVGFGIILPLLPFYVDSMAGSAEMVGYLFACFSVTQLIATPILGRISDRYGRRRVILISLAGNVISMVAFAAASKLLLLPLLFASRIVAGATSGNIAACQAAIADVTTPGERAQAMGRMGAGVTLGLVFGPLAGSVFSELGAFAPPLAAAALALVDLVGAYMFMPETHHRSRGEAPRPRMALRSLLGRWSVIAVFLLYFFTFLCITNMQVALGLLAKVRLDWGPREVGRLFAVFGAASLLVQALLIGRLVRWLGERKLVAVGASVITAGMLVISSAHVPLGLLIGVALLGAGLGIANPLLSSLASQAATEESRGSVLGFAQSSGGLARAIGPIVGGMLFARVAPAAPFLGGAAAGLVCVALAVTLPSAEGPPSERRAAPV
jgi:DHA1 family tetracycline resistance protein-like MFS transporter